MTINPDDPRNRLVLSRLAADAHGLGAPGAALSQSPADVDPWRLGTHPDLVERLWKLGRALPQDCSWVCHGRPVLAHTRTGVIFGLAIGTLGYGLRSPAPRPDRIVSRSFRGARGSFVLDWSVYGPDWAFGRWDETDTAIAQQAYRVFGKPAS